MPSQRRENKQVKTKSQQQRANGNKKVETKKQTSLIIKNFKFMKKHLLMAGVLVSSAIFAQVGVNTTNPRATLDVQANEEALSGTTNEGIIAPKLTKDRVAKIKTPVEATLVYVTNVTYSGNNDKVSEITEKGYYFYNGTKWVKSNGNNNNNSNNITASNGLTKAGNNIKLGGRLRETTNIDLNSRNLIFSGNGNIGIGTSPNSKVKLHIASSGEATVQRIENTNRDGRSWILLGADNKGLALGYDNERKRVWFNYDETLGWRTKGLMAFDVANDRVGIGTDNPTQKLEVNGNFIKITGGGDEQAYIGGDGYANDVQVGSLKAGITVVNLWNPTDRKYMDLMANRFIASNGRSFPDYVFEKYYTGESDIKSDYEFKTLNQVEEFIKTNGHLPGYKSAEEVKAEGQLDLGATQLINVEKIEELYLHTIEQDKAIKAKDAEIKELKSDVQELKSLVQQLLKK